MNTGFSSCPRGTVRPLRQWLIVALTLALTFLLSYPGILFFTWLFTTSAHASSCLGERAYRSTLRHHVHLTRLHPHCWAVRSHRHEEMFTPAQDETSLAAQATEARKAGSRAKDASPSAAGFSDGDGMVGRAWSSHGDDRNTAPPVILTPAWVAPATAPVHILYQKQGSHWIAVPATQNADLSLSSIVANALDRPRSRSCCELGIPQVAEASHDSPIPADQPRISSLPTGMGEHNREEVMPSEPISTTKPADTQPLRSSPSPEGGDDIWIAILAGILACTPFLAYCGILLGVRWWRERRIMNIPDVATVPFPAEAHRDEYLRRVMERWSEKR